MASLVEGYNYDIFISYRQKDNKGDRWVSRFVESLKTELEATFKEDVSVYFDENPHDRLQETHNVDKSLESKLKCLIFIPILSQTYCDPNSYAWQHEFLAFNRMAEKDKFGKDVTLKSGNVAGRILPVRIHDLDPDDVKLFEKETGSVLRAVEFVFRTTTGVNRPLMPGEDNPFDNLNKTFYRDQINKTAHAIKELTQGMKAGQGQNAEDKEKPDKQVKENEPGKKGIVNKTARKVIRKKSVSVIGIIAIMIIVVIIAYPKVFRNDKFKDLRDAKGKIPIAVMPFENLSGDTTLNWFRKGISSLIINGLGNSQELSVCDDPTLSEAMDGVEKAGTASLSPKQARELAKKVGVGSYISGSFQGKDGIYWIMVNLVKTENGNIIWTDKAEGNIKSSDYLNLADSLCRKIRNYLEIKALEKTADYEFREAYPQSAEAYRYFIEGMNLVLKQDYDPGIEYLRKALEIDSTFALASFYLSYAWDSWNSPHNDPAYSILKRAYYTKRAYNLKDRLPVKYQYWVEEWYACLFGNDIQDIRRYCDLLAESGINTRLLWYDLGGTYHDFLLEYDKSASAFEKVMKINRERGGEWKFEGFYDRYGHSLHMLSRHKEEQEIYDIGLRLLPDNTSIIYCKIVCLLSQGDSTSAKEYLAKEIRLYKKNGLSEFSIEMNSGFLYKEAGLFTKAEFHLRNAYNLEPKNPKIIWNLALFCIENNKVDEGIKLINNILDTMSVKKDGYRDCLLLKGIGKYKQGRYDEAVEILNKVWENGNNFYYFFYHYLSDAKQALANQKKN